LDKQHPDDIIVMMPAVFRPPYSAIYALVRRGWIAIYTICPLNSVTFSAV
ncbi:Outer membrane esterase, partial [Salmonella enterica subsp. enterica serovar Rubislaw str. A4-653]